jgi:hypothetical protein
MHLITPESAVFSWRSQVCRLTVFRTVWWHSRFKTGAQQCIPPISHVASYVHTIIGLEHRRPGRSRLAAPLEFLSGYSSNHPNSTRCPRGSAHWRHAQQRWREASFHGCQMPPCRFAVVSVQLRPCPPDEFQHRSKQRAGGRHVRCPE